MGGSVRSTFQKYQIIDELEFLHASFMLSLHYRLCGFNEDYASAKKWYYMVLWLWFLVSFMLHQRRKRILEMRWEVRFGQHFRRYGEFISLNFCMLLLCYHYVIIYAVFTLIMLWQRSHQRSCVSLILCFYVYSYSDAVMVHSIYYAYMRKHCNITAILSHGHIFSKDLLLCWIPAIIWIWYSNFMTSKEA